MAPKNTDFVTGNSPHSNDPIMGTGVVDPVTGEITYFGPNNAGGGGGIPIGSNGSALPPVTGRTAVTIIGSELPFFLGGHNPSDIPPDTTTPPPVNPPPVNPPPNNPPPTGNPPPNDISTLADAIQSLFGQNMSTPVSGGSATVIPEQTTSQSYLPIILIAAGLGAVGYTYYKKHHKKGGE
jgi:hypothetical protein